MRNRALHDALRDFALEAAALLTDELRGAEIEFDVLDEGAGRGPVLYRYRPRIAEFIGARWEELRALAACTRAARELGAGAALWLRVNGMAGERAEPALQGMLERLYEDATSFGFPEERFERVYAEVELTLYRDAVRTRVAAPLRGVLLEPERVELGDGLALVRGYRAELPPEALRADEGELPEAVVVLERDTASGDTLSAAEAVARLDGLVTAMRLFRHGAVSVAPVGWRQAGDGPWTALALAGSGPARGAPWVLEAGEEGDLRNFVRTVGEAVSVGAMAWPLARFEMGCSRAHDHEALSDYLLALRSLLDATSDTGEATLALRLAALCAEDGERRAVQRRLGSLIALERFVMGGGGPLDEQVRAESPSALVLDLEDHLRALLRDVICGYLDPDLKGVADDILLTSNEPLPIEARDLREPGPGAEADVDTTEVEALAEEPFGEELLEGVTPSADWGDPEDFSAPV